MIHCVKDNLMKYRGSNGMVLDTSSENCSKKYYSVIGTI